MHPIIEENHAHSGGSVASYEVVKNNFAHLMSLAELEDKIQPQNEVGHQLDALHDLLMFNKQKSNFEMEQDIIAWEE